MSHRAAATQILQSAEATGAVLPKAVRDAIISAQETTRGANEMTPRSLAAAMTAAIEAGRESCEDPAVQAAVASAAIVAEVRAVELFVYQRVADVCIERQDEIVAAYAVVFDQAAAAMVASHARIGDLSLEDSATIMRKGGDIAEAWTTATKADQSITRVLDAWTTVGMTVHVNIGDRRHRSLRLAALSHAELLEHGAEASAWDLVRAGIALSLPTFREFAARMTDVLDEANAPVMAVDHQRSAIAGRQILTRIR